MKINNSHIQYRRGKSKFQPEYLKIKKISFPINRNNDRFLIIKTQKEQSNKDYSNHLEKENINSIHNTNKSKQRCYFKHFMLKKLAITENL